MMDELEFRKRSDEAFASLKKSLFAAEDDADIEVEDQSGALHISFEDGARFVSFSECACTADMDFCFDDQFQT